MKLPTPNYPINPRIKELLKFPYYIFTLLLYDPLEKIIEPMTDLMW
jgi:hypothetical protein